jgi:hypothetical protein
MNILDKEKNYYFYITFCKIVRELQKKEEARPVVICMIIFINE